MSYSVHSQFETNNEIDTELFYELSSLDNKFYNINDDILPDFEPSKLKISTMTLVGSTGSCIDLKKLFENLDVPDRKTLYSTIGITKEDFIKKTKMVNKQCKELLKKMFSSTDIKHIEDMIKTTSNYIDTNIFKNISDVSNISSILELFKNSNSITTIKKNLKKILPKEEHIHIQDIVTKYFSNINSINEYLHNLDIIELTKLIKFYNLKYNEEFFDYINANNILSIEYGSSKLESNIRGISNKKKNKKKTTVNKKKRFDNQATIHWITKKNDEDEYYILNMKVFRNGETQMTGVKDEKHAINAIHKLIDECKKLHEKNINVCITKNPKELIPSNIKTCLINSDFKVGFEIRRDNLHRIVNDKYNNFCVYEPCSYPGVKIQYYWNKDNIENNGICSCTNNCNGKGSGKGDGECIKVTISTFQSGCILVIGNARDQINSAYNYICNIIKNNRKDIYKPKLLIP